MTSNTWNQLTVSKQMMYIELSVLDNKTWNHLIVYKQMNSSLLPKKFR